MGTLMVLAAPSGYDGQMRECMEMPLSLVPDAAHALQKNGSYCDDGHYLDKFLEIPPPHEASIYSVCVCR